MKKDREQWIIEQTIEDLQRAMGQGETSAEELVGIYLERIEKYDAELKSIIEVNPDAISIARELDEERRLKGPRGPLHGIPIVLKDNIDTHDRLHTSAGSIALADSIAAEDSAVASALREAGAIFLGKANMTEWANFMSGTMWAGYGSRFGQTKNPYGLGDTSVEMFVGGSSSGSAVAVAANLAAASIGTETAGSIVCPASQNCVVGIKPTVGLVSRRGVIPITSSQDTVGPIARTVADAAILLGAIVCEDERDAATAGSSKHAYKDYTVFLQADGLKGARIGIPRYLYNELDEEQAVIMNAAISVMEREGAVIVDPVSIPSEAMNWTHEVMRHEFKKGINDYLSALPDTIPIHSLSELIAYNEKHADRALKYGQDTLLWSEETSGTLTEQAYLDSKAQDIEYSRKQGIDYVLEQHKLDALLIPGMYEGTDIPGKAGYPLVTVPAGYIENGSMKPGLPTKGPLGVVFAGTAFSEPTLIKLAYSFEQATKFRFPPKL